MSDEVKIEAVEADTTPAWKSKTLWASLIVAAAPLFPPAQVLIAANPDIALGIVSALFAFLRMLNGKKIPVIGTSGKPVSVKK